MAMPNDTRSPSGSATLHFCAATANDPIPSPSPVGAVATTRSRWVTVRASGRAPYSAFRADHFVVRGLRVLTWGGLPARRAGAASVRLVMRTTSHPFTAPRGLLGVALGLTICLAACGDDDTSPEDAFCDAADSLEANISALGDIDVAAEGTNAVDDAFAEIESDVTELRDTGADVAEAELSALEDALSSLESTTEQISDSPSPDQIVEVVSDVNDTLTAAAAVVTTLQETCG